jgi:hypothetical protein
VVIAGFVTKGKEGKMEKLRFARLIAVIISCLLIAPSSFAITETVAGWYGVFGQSAGQEIYGQYVNSESYSRLDAFEDYDPGSLEYFWDWHLWSEAETASSQGTVTASSQTPNGVGAWMENGSIITDLNESVETLAWTNTQSVYSPVTAETVDISLYSESRFNLFEGIDGNLKIYFGIWENEVAAGNLMLDEKDGWSLSQLDFNGQTYTLLQQTLTSFSETNSTWSLDFQAGQDYEFFTYMVAETIPEPATLLLIGSGALLMRRRR